jgi:hypothetical protein
MSEIDLLKEELEYFKNEKEKVRRIIGGIGGTSSRRRDRLINVLFLIVVVASFAFEVLRDTLHIGPAWFPPNVSLSLAILLVSVKIIWMIHIQSRIDHFQFWILNSIEFEINQISKRIRSIEKLLKEQETQGS